MTDIPKKKRVKNPILREIIKQVQKEKEKRCTFPHWGNWGNWANWGNWGNWGNWFNWWN